MSPAEQDVRQRTYSRESFSRSPHPYRRRGHGPTKNEPSTSGTESAQNDIRSSDSSEDHALEADDEKGPLLRLPAPPIQARKGLKGAKDPSLDWTPAISPVPTPVVEKSEFISTAQAEAGASKQQKDDSYRRYRRKRRGEIVRRVAETLLLMAVGLLSSVKPVDDGDRLSVVVKPELLKWKIELAAFFTIFCFCYCLYPLRRTVKLARKGVSVLSAVRTGFHVPSRFDPGVLLYPVMLPLWIAASTGEGNATILVNIILGLASMPAQVIPFGSYDWYHVQWVLSVLPMSGLKIFGKRPSMLKLSENTVYTDFQEMSLLFPLHQIMLGVISDLVTTSLDPTETHLLSAGLINLLVFAATPQSQILKALLWIGGTCLFVFCERALKAEVALARIPAWRFARNRPSKKGLGGRLNRLLRAILPESRSRFAASASSDSEDEKSPEISVPKRIQRIKSQAAISHDESSDNKLEKALSVNQFSPYGPTPTPTSIPKLARSATFSTFGRAALTAVKWKNLAASSNPYLRLTYLQAQATKLLLAIYVYIATAVIILLPVRYFITSRALCGDEAIGWAIGYFAGDIPEARMLVVTSNLEWWVKLPLHKSQAALDTGTGWIQQYQHRTIGAANTRLFLAAYCVFVVGCGIVVVLQLQKVVEVDTRRKVFHGVMVAMLLPTIPVDPCFFALALTIVLAVFLMLDLFRASQLPPISRPLTNFLAPYVDGRDHRGPVIVSHIFLLIGCAIPLWLSLASVQRTGDGPSKGWIVAYRDLSMISGVVCVGMGDAAASLIGRRYGRTKWYWGGGKSIEGSVAFAFAVMVGLTASWLWLRVGGWVHFESGELPMAMVKALAAGTGASLMESTLTAANDNVVVPIGLWLLVRGLRI